MNTKEYETFHFELEINSNKIGLGDLLDKEYKEQDNNENDSDGNVDIGALLLTQQFEKV